MTSKTPKIISPREAAALLKDGAVLIDIREGSERSDVIAEAQHAPLSEIDKNQLPRTDRPLIFHCRTGRRTAMNADLLQNKAGDCAVYLVEGGIEAWAAEGLPVRPAAN